MELAETKIAMAKLLRDCGLLPAKQGQVILHISPEGIISSIEVHALYK